MSSKEASDGPLSPPQPTTTPTTINPSSILTKMKKDRKVVIGVSSACLLILVITVAVATANRCYCNGSPDECDQDTGACTRCKEGFTGERCEKCLPNVVGDNCEECTANHWNFTITTGCESCDCDPKGKIVFQRKHYSRRNYFSWQVPSPSSVTRIVANASVSRTLLVTNVTIALRITGILPIRPVVSLVTVILKVRLSFNEGIIRDAFTSPGRFPQPPV